MRIIHGGDIYSKDIKYDFSANINPLGMPERVKKVICENIRLFERYPDCKCTSLKRAIADKENVSEKNIVCGNGASDLIYRIVRTICPKKALLIAPTFSEYEKALIQNNCNIEYYYLSEKYNFIIKEDILDKLVEKDIIFICQPNNPIGNVTDGKLLKKIAYKCREKNIILVVDESFLDFVPEYWQYELKAFGDYVIILKAFTKIYAMAGLRLGYLICMNKNLCEIIEDCGQCWSVSVPAQISGEVALKESAYIEKTVNYVSSERNYLTENLKDLGFKIYPSESNFLMIKTNIPLDDMLLKEKIAIRNCDNYVGLGKGYFRIAVRTHEENEILIKALERIIKTWQKQ